ncbi:substrate-binding periplasmic protein [Balneatrix alpica]|uniref:Substrate-binding periplasmic protein n=1 Tax=Balneatrix alpica TaxID=75684 RepID=A0ABV5ZBX1_9GAMM|nr:transporter substrate-binding domain-containing protein [Balneatrix alpica]
MIRLQVSLSSQWSNILRLGVAICLVGASFAVGAKECSRIIATGNAEYPPILYRNANHPGFLTGISVDLLREAVTPLGQELVVRDRGSWARAQYEAESGAVDMLAGAFMTEPRKAYMDYIEPAFMQIPSVIWVRQGETFNYQQWSDLQGRRGGTLINNSFGEDFDRYAREHLAIEEVGSIETAFAKLEMGRTDYVIYELYQALPLLEQADFKGKFEPLSKPVSIENLYFTVSKKSECNSPAWRQQLSEQVQKLVEQQRPASMLSDYSWM